MGGPFLLRPTLCHHNSGTWCPTGTFVPQLVLVVGPFSLDRSNWLVRVWDGNYAIAEKSFECRRLPIWKKCLIRDVWWCVSFVETRPTKLGPIQRVQNIIDIVQILWHYHKQWISGSFVMQIFGNRNLCLANIDFCIVVCWIMQIYQWEQYWANRNSTLPIGAKIDQ